MREEVEAEALRRTARQENMRKELEVSREVAENVEMAAEDVRSAIPVKCLVSLVRRACDRLGIIHPDLNPSRQLILRC